MKGITLPINAIVVVAVAVLVLVVLSAFFAGWFGASTSEVGLETTLNKACNTWRQTYNCAPREEGYLIETTMYQPVGESEPQPHSVADLCGFLGLTTVDACYKKCGCPYT